MSLHGGIMRLDPGLIERLMDLPDDVHIVDVHEEGDSMIGRRHIWVKVIGPGLPAVEQGSLLPFVDPIYARDSTKPAGARFQEWRSE